MNNRLMGAVLLTVLFGFAPRADATPLAFSFTDPVGDYTGTIDLTGLTFLFDNATGTYTINLTASAANPFFGNFRININLFNPDTGSTANEFFQDTINDFTLFAPTTLVMLTGTDSKLLAWEPGDRVAINSGPFGNPVGTSLFRSGVLDLPLGGALREDFYGTFSPGDFAVISAVPEPASMTLLGTGLLALLNVRRRPQVA